jgi:peptide/nickel transport system substrate-binding protein
MKKNPVYDRSVSTRRDFLRHSALAGVGLSAAGFPGVGWSVEDDVLRIRNYIDVRSLDPALMLSGGEALIGTTIYLSLVQFKPGNTWEWELDAAESFEQIDDTHYDFRLRRGIMFSNGFGEMTAEDVKFSLERVIDPDTQSPNIGDMGPLSHVEVTGRYTGTIVMKSPFAAFTAIAMCGGTGSIVSKKGLESVGGSYMVEPPCCSGPYHFVSWESQRKTVLEPNPDWSGPKPAFREIHIYAMTDEKAAELAYEAGEIDCTAVAIESVDIFQRKLPPNSRLDVISSLRFFWIGLNQDHPKLTDIRVRKAVQYGINVEAVIEAAWFGLGTPATGIIAPGLIGYREKADIPLAGDPDKALQLLKEAGVKLPLKLTLAMESDALEMTAAQVAQWSLAKAGIELELQPQDNATLITMGMESAGDRWKDLQLHLQSFYMLGDPYYATEWFVSEMVGVWNWERFRNPEFDHLHKLALSETDVAERDRMYQEMQHLMEDSGCYRFLAHGVEAMLSRLHLVPAYRADGYPMFRDFGLAGPQKV